MLERRLEILTERILLQRDIFRLRGSINDLEKGLRKKDPELTRSAQRRIIDSVMNSEFVEVIKERYGESRAAAERRALLAGVVLHMHSKSIKEKGAKKPGQESWVLYFAGIEIFRTNPKSNISNGLRRSADNIFMNCTRNMNPGGEDSTNGSVAYYKNIARLIQLGDNPEPLEELLQKFVNIESYSQTYPDKKHQP